MPVLFSRFAARPIQKKTECKLLRMQEPAMKMLRDDLFCFLLSLASLPWLLCAPVAASVAAAACCSTVLLGFSFAVCLFLLTFHCICIASSCIFYGECIKHCKARRGLLKRVRRKPLLQHVPNKIRNSYGFQKGRQTKKRRTAVQGIVRLS